MKILHVIKNIFLYALLFLSCYGLFHFHPKNIATWCIFIGIALLLILFDRLEKFNLFGILSGTVKKAKKEINDESEKIKVQLILSGIVSDSLGNEREGICDFLTNGKIDSTKEMKRQFCITFRHI